MDRSNNNIIPLYSSEKETGESFRVLVRKNKVKSFAGKALSLLVGAAILAGTIVGLSKKGKEEESSEILPTIAQQQRDDNETLVINAEECDLSNVAVVLSYDRDDCKVIVDKTHERLQELGIASYICKDADSIVEKVCGAAMDNENAIILNLFTGTLNNTTQNVIMADYYSNDKEGTDSLSVYNENISDFWALALDNSLTDTTIKTGRYDPQQGSRVATDIETVIYNSEQIASLDRSIKTLTFSPASENMSQAGDMVEGIVDSVIKMSYMAHKPEEIHSRHLAVTGRDVFNWYEVRQNGIDDKIYEGASMDGNNTMLPNEIVQVKKWDVALRDAKINYSTKQK